MTAKVVSQILCFWSPGHRRPSHCTKLKPLQHSETVFMLKYVTQLTTKKVRRVFEGVSDLLCCSRGLRRCCDFWLCCSRYDCLWFLTRWLLYCWTGLVELRKSQLVSGTCCVLCTLHEALISLLVIRCFILNKEK